MRRRVHIGWAEDVPEGGSLGFDPDATGRDTLFVVRSGGDLHAWYDRCPHEGVTPLPLKRHVYLNAKRTRIVCFAHGAQFEIASGECVVGPCRGSRLERAAVTVDADGGLLFDAEETPGRPTGRVTGGGDDAGGRRPPGECLAVQTVERSWNS